MTAIRFSRDFHFLYTLKLTINFNVYIIIMDLVLDKQKRERTLQERGMDLASVAEADWDKALTVEDSRTDYGEARFVSLVPISERLCVVA